MEPDARLLRVSQVLRRTSTPGSRPLAGARLCRRALVMAGVVGTLLLGHLTGTPADAREADTPQAAAHCSDGWPPCCALGVQNPYLDDGYVSTSLRWDCNYLPDQVTLRLELRRNGVVMEADEVYYGREGHWVMFLSEVCSPGSWQAEATAWYRDWWLVFRWLPSPSQTRSLTCSTPPPPPSTTTTTRPNTTTTRACPNPPHCHPE
jgi:hypothetical protein